VVARRTRKCDALGRTLLSRLYYRLVNSMVEVRIEDGVGDFRLLSRRAVDALLQLGEYNRFSKGLFAWIGFPTATIDYRNEARFGGDTSRWSFRRLLNYGIDGVMSFNNAPLRLAIYVGLVVTALAFGYAGYLVVAAMVQGIAVPGYVTLVAAVVGLGGLQLLFLGVIGEYVGRIYYEAKKRPHYLVAETSEDQQPVGVREHPCLPARDTVVVDNHVAPEALSGHVVSRWPMHAEALRAAEGASALHSGTPPSTPRRPDGSVGPIPGAPGPRT
jgi:polyisoprenyl-phosphate glycosyltransferase